jgi:TolB-like protein
MADAADPGNPKAPVPGAQPTAEPARVFISYASNDAAVARNVCSVLEAGGFPCWIAPRDVVPGTLYADGIVRAINDSTVLVLILSASAVASAHVGKELERASSKRHPIIALRTDTAPLTPVFEYFLSESQWIDAGTNGTDIAIAKLVAAVQQHLTPRSTPSLHVAPQVPASGHKAESPRRSWWVIAVAIVAVCLVALTVGRFWLATHTTAESPTPAATSVVSDKSIAVLPFTDMSEKHDQEYFADGMAEEILDLLSKIPGLRVIGRTSSFQFKGRNEDLREVGRELGAAYVLEGSVRKVGDQVRVTAQLIDANSGVHRWSETYDRPFLDVLKLQDEIATALARELQTSLGANDLHSRGVLRNAEAYNTYLRGLHSLDRVDRAGFEEAAAYMRQALASDPTLAPAAAKLAYILDLQAEWAVVPAAAGYDEARRAAENALRLDPTRALPHAVLAETHLYRREWAAADAELRQAVALDPRDPDTLMLASYEADAFGRVDEAARLANAGVIVDPLSALAHEVLAEARDAQGRPEEAAAEYRRVLEISPTFETAHWELGEVELEQGHVEAALTDMKAEPHAGRRDAGLAIVYHALGRKTESDAAVARLEAESADTWAYGVALVHACRGEADQTFRWLDRAYLQYDQVYWAPADSCFDNLHSDPRYTAFLRKLNLPH